MGLREEVRSLLQAAGRLAQGLGLLVAAIICLAFLYGVAMVVFDEYLDVALPDPTESVQAIIRWLRGGDG